MCVYIYIYINTYKVSTWAEKYTCRRSVVGRPRQYICTHKYTYINTYKVSTWSEKYTCRRSVVGRPLEPHGHATSISSSQS